MRERRWKSYAPAAFIPLIYTAPRHLPWLTIDLSLRADARGSRPFYLAFVYDWLRCLLRESSAREAAGSKSSVLTCLYPPGTVGKTSSLKITDTEFDCFEEQHNVDRFAIEKSTALHC